MIQNHEEFFKHLYEIDKKEYDTGCYKDDSEEMDMLRAICGNQQKYIDMWLKYDINAYDLSFLETNPYEVSRYMCEVADDSILGNDDMIHIAETLMNLNVDDMFPLSVIPVYCHHYSKLFDDKHFEDYIIYKSTSLFLEIMLTENVESVYALIHKYNKYYLEFIPKYRCEYGYYLNTNTENKKKLKKILLYFRNN